MAICASLLSGGCTTRNVVAVEVGDVTAYPSSAVLLDGQALQFSATVTDIDGRPVSGARVTWETEDEDVVSIDGAGLLWALREGTTTVHASFGGVSGSSVVTVLPDAVLEAGDDTVVFHAAVGQPSPTPLVLQVSVAGFGRIGGLEASVEFSAGQPDGWLTAALADTVPPTSLTLATATSTLAPGAYNATVSVDSNDDDGPVQLFVLLRVTGFTVTQSDGSSSVSEAGGKDTLSVVLDAPPVTDVLVDVASSDPAEVTVSPGRLAFTPSTWDVPQVVTLTGVDDLDMDGDQTTNVTISVVDALSDAAFGPVPDREILVTTVDDDVVALTVEETNGSTRVTEAGGRDSVTVVLQAPPSSEVSVLVTRSDPSEVRLESGTLKFTPSNWNVPRIVVVRPEDDETVDGDVTSEISFAVQTGSDPEFLAGSARSVVVTTVDDDVAGFIVAESGGSTTVREGGRDDLKIKLAAQPLSNVVIAITSADPDYVVVAPVFVTFTPQNWSKDQEVAVYGVENNRFDFFRWVDLAFSVQDSVSDDAFDAVDDRIVRVRFLD